MSKSTIKILYLTRSRYRASWKILINGHLDRIPLSKMDQDYRDKKKFQKRRQDIQTSNFYPDVLRKAKLKRVS